MKLLILLFCVLFLSHCATVPSQLAAQNQVIPWSERVQTLSQITSWDITGQIAVRTDRDAFSANCLWQQQQKNYAISLWGPMGTGSIKLTGQPGLVELKTADGKTLTAVSPDRLLAEQLGWKLPVSHLAYWIRGLPAPGLPAKKEFDAYHHLILLTQDGWHIHYLRYASVNQMDLPTKLFLDAPLLNIKIIINQWRF